MNTKRITENLIDETLNYTTIEGVKHNPFAKIREGDIVVRIIGLFEKKDERGNPKGFKLSLVLL